jgi:hypothetical protein
MITHTSFTVTETQALIMFALTMSSLKIIHKEEDAWPYFYGHNIKSPI